MQSALKKDGKPLYAYAREGIEVEREARQVVIHSIDIESWDAPAFELTLSVRCSKGTYIRTLAEDIGRALGCGAHLAGLRRTQSGSLRLAQAVSLERLHELDEPQRDAWLKHPDALLQSWPAHCLPRDEAARFLTGLRRRVTEADRAAVRVYGPEPAALLGSAHITAGELIADRLLSPVEVQELLEFRKVNP